MSKKDKEFISIPIHLARLLVAEPGDYKDKAKFDEISALAKSLLKLLLRMEKEK